MKLSNYPILRGLVPYILGVFLAYFSPSFFIKHLIFFLLSLYVFLAIFLLTGIVFHSLLKMAHVVFFFLFFSLGFILSYEKISGVSIFYRQENAPFSGKMAARVLAPPVKKEKSVHVLAKIFSNDISAQSCALLYIQNDSSARALAAGDLLLFHTPLRPPSPPRNPDAFDYRSNLLRKGVAFTAYLDSRSWILLHHDSRYSLIRAAAALQSRFSGLFASSGLSGPEYSVITALLLGNDETMDSDLKAGYAAAGVSHILCVSGMHVGIIFMILNFLLKPLDYFRRLRYLKSVLLICAVWFYAALTGLGPSVQRSATMFTFVAVGGMLRRNVNVFHSLFASMFVLLIVNPLLIFEIGFEMSYLAVFGIVVFQPRLVALFSPKLRIGRYFWELICVSVAAQLATFPLSVYYFSQFPNYFLLSNLSVMSLSFVVIITGVAVLALSWWPAAAGAAGWLLSHEIQLMNGIISFISTLPCSVTDRLSFTIIQTLLIYGIIILFFLSFIRKNKILKYSYLSLSIVLLSTFAVTRFQRFSRQEITFYSVDRRTVVGVNQHGKGFLLLDSSALATSDWYDFHVKKHEIRQGLSSEFVALDSSLREGDIYLKDHFLCFGGRSFYFLSRKSRLYPASPPLHLDCLFVQDNAGIPLSRLLETFEFKQVIIGNAVSYYHEKRWLDSCEARKIPVYSLRENGYLTLKPDI